MNIRCQRKPSHLKITVDKLFLLFNVDDGFDLFKLTKKHSNSMLSIVVCRLQFYLAKKSQNIYNFTFMISNFWHFKVHNEWLERSCDEMLPAGFINGQCKYDLVFSVRLSFFFYVKTMYLPVQNHSWRFYKRPEKIR